MVCNCRALRNSSTAWSSWDAIEARISWQNGKKWCGSHHSLLLNRGGRFSLHDLEERVKHNDDECIV